jgi:glycosyltransferase involved in cell wall biosynthesis
VRIGIVPLLHNDSGGVYQYSLTMMAALRSIDLAGDQLVAFIKDEFRGELDALGPAPWTVRPLYPPTVRRRVSKLVRTTGLGALVDRLRGASAEPAGRRAPPPVRRDDAEQRRWFKANGIDLVVYSVPMSMAFEAGLPYVMAVHDLQHRLQPHFPEVSADGEFEAREYLYGHGVANAAAILVDSEVGREDVLACYPGAIAPEQVKVLPFLPACYLGAEVSPAERQRVRDRYRLPERYFFYPAQFWPHKNHRRIVEALGLLARDGIRATLVLCGSNRNAVRERTFAETMAAAEQSGVADQIAYHGYVPNEDMAALYAEAEALVMPTFFGPTNIPILEAWAAGCPVLTSDLRGVRDQAGDAAVLADPESVEAIADGMRRLWTDAALRGMLAARGRARLASYTPEHFAARLADAIATAKQWVEARG